MTSNPDLTERADALLCELQRVWRRLPWWQRAAVRVKQCIKVMVLSELYRDKGQLGLLVRIGSRQRVWRFRIVGRG